MPGEAKHPVKAARTTFRIIEAIEEADGAGVTELANRLDLAKSSVHNYLSTLREEGYVTKEGSTYHVGLRFLDLGVSARHRQEVYDVARPEVAQLAEETGELANLLVEEHGHGIYIYRKSGDQAVSVDAHVGHRVSLHNTALGKAILAYLPRTRVEEILDTHGLPATTDATITDREVLYDRLQDVRERGVAFDREERLDGLRCVAAPIVDRNETVAGAVSIAGPTSRMKGDRFKHELPERLRSAANVIELNITYA